jgi:hypothetical protein
MGALHCYGEAELPHLCDLVARDKTGPVLRRNALPPPGQPVKPKTLAEKAFSLGAAILKEVVSGTGPVSDELYEARLAVCFKPCEFMKDRTCLLCDCKLKAKARLSQTECPVGLWPDSSS